MRKIPILLIPRLIINYLCGKLGLSQWLLAGGRAYKMKDARGSITLLIVQLEHSAKFYKPLVALRPGDTVLDLGAHVGGFTIPLAARHPKTNFICYEPDPINYANLKRNVRNAKLKNVSAHLTAVAPKDGPMEIKHDRSNTGGSTAQPSQTLTGNGGTTYANIRKQHGLDKIRLLKIDIEGAEHDCFKSEEDWNNVDSLIAEIHCAPNLDTTPTLEHFKKCARYRLFLEPSKPELVEN